MKKLFFLTLLLSLLCAPTFASSIAEQSLVTFQSNSVAKAQDVNDNFTIIKGAVNDNDQRVIELQTQLNSLEAKVGHLSTTIFSTLFFPHVMTTNGKLAIAQGSGYIQYNGGDQVLMGGEQLGFPGFNLNTLASTTYHLRYNKVDGWQLLDVTDASYNPDALDENNPMFDSKQTNMLAAKVETDANNNTIVTPLVNRDRLAFSISSVYGCEALPEKAQDNVTFTDVATGKTIAGTFDKHQRSLL